MRSPNLFLKIMSVLPSLALVVGFLLTARWFMFVGGTKANPTFSFVGSSIRPTSPASTPTPMPPPPFVPAAPAAAKKEPVFLGGSKSSFVFQGNGIKAPGAPARPVPPIPLAE